MALKRIRDESRYKDDSKNGLEPKKSREIVLPEEIAKRLDQAQDHGNENFVRQMAEWISREWHITRDQADELLRTGRTCDGHDCLAIRRISNFCCPFGK